MRIKCHAEAVDALLLEHSLTPGKKEVCSFIRPSRIVGFCHVLRGQESLFVDSFLLLAYKSLTPNLHGLLETQAHGEDWLSLSNYHEIIFRLYLAYFSLKSLPVVPSPISGTWW